MEKARVDGGTPRRNAVGRVRHRGDGRALGALTITGVPEGYLWRSAYVEVGFGR